MSTVGQLEAHGAELATAIQSLATYCRTQGEACPSDDANAPLVGPDAPSEVHRVRRSALAHLAQLQNLLQQPSDLLQQLAAQNQLLACLGWLGEFQVLALIPPHGSIPTASVADLAGVPEAHLSRVVGLMATSGFLHQPQPDRVAHTPLSAPFVRSPALLDAALFLSEVAAPSALQMAAATQRTGAAGSPGPTAWSLALDPDVCFQGAYESRPRLQRQWRAYRRHGTGDYAMSVREVLMQFDWAKLASDDGATVVEAGAPSTATASALVHSHPSLRLVVQMDGPGPADVAPPRMRVEQRRPGAVQTVLDAAVYIVHLPSTSPLVPAAELRMRISAELRAHVSVLAANANATLLLVPGPLLRPETQGDSVAQLRDLALWQLANAQEMGLPELLELVGGVGDSMGRLAVVAQLSARHNGAVVLEARYQSRM